MQSGNFACRKKYLIKITDYFAALWILNEEKIGEDVYVERIVIRKER